MQNNTPDISSINHNRLHYSLCYRHNNTCTRCLPVLSKCRSGSGIEFSTASEGRITAIRVWEYPGNYITGIQLRYESNWTAVFGSEYGNQQEMQLYDKEIIIQVSGKHSGYIYELMFVTTLGRSFKVGMSAGTSFNFFPTMKGSQLRFLSGRHDGWAISSIGAHWALVAVK